MVNNPNMGFGSLNLGGVAPTQGPPAVGPQITATQPQVPSLDIKPASTQMMSPPAAAAPVQPSPALNMSGTGPSTLNTGQTGMEAAMPTDLTGGTAAPTITAETVNNLRKSGATDASIAKMLYSTQPNFQQRADALVPFFQKQDPAWVQQNSPTWLLNAVYKKGEGNKLPDPQLQAVMDYVSGQQKSRQNDFMGQALNVAVSPVSFADDVATRFGEYAMNKTTVNPEVMKQKMTKDLGDLGTLTQVIGLVVGPELAAGEAATQLPVIGGLLDKMGGTFFGKTILRAVGGALGNVAGSIPKDISNDIQGKPTNIAGQAGQGALLTAAPDLVLGALRKVLQPFAPYVTDAMHKLMQTMDENGVPYNAAGILKESPDFNKISGMGKGVISDLGGAPVTEGAAIPGIQQMGQDAIDAAAPTGAENIATDALTQNQDLAKTMKENFSASEKVHSAEVTRLFDARDSKLESLISTAQTTGSIPSSELSPDVMRLASVDVTPASKMLQDNESELADLKRQLGMDFGLGKANKANRTLNNLGIHASDAQKLQQAQELQNSLSAINSAVRQASGFGEGTAKNVDVSLLKGLGGSISKSLDAFYKQLPELDSLKKAASSYYSEAAPAFAKGSPIVDALNSAGENTSTVPDLFLNAFKNGKADQVARQFEVLGPEAKQGIQQYMMKDIINGGTDTLSGEITPKSLQQGLDKYGQETISRILDPEQLKAIQELQQIARVSSNSAKKSIGILTPDRLAFMLRGFTTDLVPMVVKSIVKNVVGQEAAQAMITKYLTDGITLGLPQSTWDVLQSAMSGVLRARGAMNQDKNGQTKEKPQASANPSFDSYVASTGANISQYYNGTFDQAHGISFKDNRSEHGAYDLAAPEGTPWKPMVGGTVISMGPDGGFGNTVKIKDEKGNVYIYGHFKALNSDIKVGDTISPSTPIGQVGMTGNATGPHVHFEVHNPEGQTVDPAVTQLA